MGSMLLRYFIFETFDISSFPLYGHFCKTFGLLSLAVFSSSLTIGLWFLVPDIKSHHSMRGILNIGRKSSESFLVEKLNFTLRKKRKKNFKTSETYEDDFFTFNLSIGIFMFSDMLNDTQSLLKLHFSNSATVVLDDSHFSIFKNWNVAPSTDSATSINDKIVQTK
jgi:hypothetical protein